MAENRISWTGMVLPSVHLRLLVVVMGMIVLVLLAAQHPAWTRLDGFFVHVGPAIGLVLGTRARAGAAACPSPNPRRSNP